MHQAAAAAVAALEARFGDRLITSGAELAAHASTTSWVAPQPPDAVVFVETEDDVRAVVLACAGNNCPLIGFGAGTSFEGSVNAPRGGISVDFSRMNALKAVHDEDADCVVEPGILRLSLNEQLKPHGLFFAVDPGSNASLGGMASTRASGTNAARLGTMRENILSLRVVMPDGEVVSTASRSRKSSAGYDLTRLFIGAEGTLGLITELTLKLAALPRFVAAAVCSFPTVEAACNAYVASVRTGMPPARVELLDEAQVVASNRFSNLQLEPRPTLFLEFNGTEASARELAESFGETAAAHGGGAFTWAASADDRAALWKARSNAHHAAKALRPDARPVVTDVCVPISRLAECLRETQADIARSGLIAPMVAHVGDGNFHACVLVDMADADEVARARAFTDRLVRRAIDMDGTCTGEHGVGQGKAKYLEAEHGAAAVALMRRLKQAFDPADIMNPGKILAPLG